MIKTAKHGNNKCNQTRTMFNLFQIYNCHNCDKFKEDEFIKIGNQIIAIYYIFNQCEFLGINKDVLVYNSKKVKILLKESIINDKNIFLFFVDGFFEIDKYFNLFERIMDNDLDIQIITL